MRVLGIDPGLNITGYGMLAPGDSGPEVVEAGVIRSDASDDLADRLCELGREVADVIRQFSPDCMAVEDLYAHYAHPRTAIIMGHARGVILMQAAMAGIRVHSYAATRIKKSLTGNGRASKAQMQQMIANTLGLATVPEPADAADALAVALCHFRAMQHGEEIRV